MGRIIVLKIQNLNIEKRKIPKKIFQTREPRKNVKRTWKGKHLSGYDTNTVATTKPPLCRNTQSPPVVLEPTAITYRCRVVSLGSKK